ncbi:tripartite motif-containing protein 2-like [Lingula anatina]|uniref:Tripartite motif-containing protein 2-like n=1 Tax=Lingula anatina TaxID=7574 RepID=A0A1S3KD18_LINAN|nr:tripartite motif-containing protein 2-like [Lingula anatina]|eukprot:XP_013420349.1 tripartite motif-containing protein 2-like [Lingula anatina]
MSLSKILTEDFLTCSICHEKFKEPKVLSCSHTFCQHCLQDHWDSNFQGQLQFPCPICRRQCDLPVGGVSRLQTNHLVVSISHTLAQVEQAKATKKCELCCLKNVPNPPTATNRCLNCEENMCGDCSSDHVLHKLNRDHKLFPVDQLGSDKYVTELHARQNVFCDHNNKDPVEIFCPVCKKYICATCMCLEHKNHDCLRIKNAADKRKEKLELLVRHTEKKRPLYGHFKTAAEDQKTSVEEGRKKAKSQVNKQLELVIKIAHQRAEDLLGEIDAKSNAKLEVLNALIANATAEQNQLDDVVDFSRKLINHGNDMDVLQMASACEQISESIHAIKIPTLPAAMTQLQLITNDMEECVTNINRCLGDVVPAVSGRLVTTFKVELTKSPEEMITHVTTDTNGDILIGIWCDEDFSRNRIHIYDATFVLQGTIPNPKTAENETGGNVRTFHSESPEAVAVNSKGHYVVAGHNTLTVHHKDGKVLQTTPDPGGKCVKHIHCNVNDDVIVTDPGNDHIRVYDPTLQFKYRYGTQGDGDAQVDGPLGTCSLDNGDIILTDFINHRLHLVSPDGKFKQFILSKDNGLFNPRDVTINHLGKLVVAEEGGQINFFELILVPGEMSLSKILTEDFLTCSICLEKFKVPKALSCSHTFCQHCLQDYLDRNFQGQPCFPCPICRRQCDLPGGGVSRLQTNHLVVSISHTLAQVEKAKTVKKCEVCCLKNVLNPPTATKRCLNCEENMCGDCSSDHVLHKLNRDHKLFPVDQLGSDEYVAELRARQNVLCDHNNEDPVEIFCPVCKKYICPTCSFLEHQGHNCLRINAAADKRKEKLELLVRPIEKKSLLYDQFKTAAEDQKKSVEEGRKKAKS